MNKIIPRLKRWGIFVFSFLRYAGGVGADGGKAATEFNAEGRTSRG